MGVFRIDTSKVRDLTPEVIGPDGRMRVLPAAYWAATTPQERGYFGHQHGIYSFPTTELVEYLRGAVGDGPAIEIGAGHGVLADALGIPGTDTREQEGAVGMIVALHGQPVVKYGPNVWKMAGNPAVRRAGREAVVIACWVTQDYVPGTPWKQDSKLDGVDEDDVLEHCREYIFIGNEEIHKGKRIWRHPHRIEYPPFVYSRAMNGARDFIAHWSPPRRYGKGRK